jgi:hypothetical protein
MRGGTFGWDYPPGVTERDIDDRFGEWPACGNCSEPAEPGEDCEECGAYQPTKGDMADEAAERMLDL